MYPLITTTLTLMAALTGRARTAWANRHDEDGNTLEAVIITLGLMAVAGLLVAAVTAAVKSRTDQIK